MTPPGTVNATDQAKLIDYLTNYNGSLYIEGTKLAYDHMGSSLMSHFGIKFEDHGDIFEVNALESKDIALLDDVSFVHKGGDSPHYLVDRLVTTGAELLYSCEQGYHRTYVYSPDDQYRVITSSALFGANKDADSLSIKPYLIAEIVNYLLGIGQTTSIQNLFASGDNLNAAGYPNPFVSETTISFTLETSEMVRINIFDHSGRVVNTLINNNMPAGKNSITWNGDDISGRNLPPGIYFYNIETANQSSSGKLILTR